MQSPICDEKNCATPVILDQPDAIPPTLMTQVNQIMQEIGCKADPEQDFKITGMHSIGYRCDPNINVKLNHYIENNAPKTDLWMFINDTKFFKEYKLPTRVTGKLDGSIDFITSNGNLEGSAVISNDQITKSKVANVLKKLEKLRSQIMQLNTDEFMKDFNQIKNLAQGAKDAPSTDLFNTDSLHTEVQKFEGAVGAFKKKYGVTITDIYQAPPVSTQKENILVELGRQFKLIG